MSYIDTLLNFRHEVIPSPFWSAFSDSGLLYSTAITLGTLSIPFALLAIYKRWALPCQFLACMVPFTMTSIASHIYALGIFSYMSFPSPEFIGETHIFATRIFAAGTFASAVLALLAFLLWMRRAFIYGTALRE